MFSTEVSVYGEKVTQRRLLRFADAAEDQRPTFRGVARILERATARNFATSGRYGGSPWRPLKPATLARKARLGLDPRILQATHRLHDSLVHRSHPEHVESIDRDRLEWGSRVPYGVYHQSTRPRRVIPYRPPVRLNEFTQRQVTKAFHESLWGAVTGPVGGPVLLRDVLGRFRAMQGAV